MLEGAVLVTIGEVCFTAVWRRSMHSSAMIMLGLSWTWINEVYYSKQLIASGKTIIILLIFCKKKAVPTAMLWVLLVCWWKWYERMLLSLWEWWYERMQPLLPLSFCVTDECFLDISVCWNFRFPTCCFFLRTHFFICLVYLLSSICLINLLVLLQLRRLISPGTCSNGKHCLIQRNTS